MTRTAAIPVLHGALAAPVTRTIRNIPTASFDNLRVVAKAYLLEACEALRSAVDC
jgi:hypothetical protein